MEAAKETGPNFKSSGGRQHNCAQNWSFVVLLGTEMRTRWKNRYAALSCPSRPRSRSSQGGRGWVGWARAPLGCGKGLAGSRMGPVVSTWTHAWKDTVEVCELRGRVEKGPSTVFLLHRHSKNTSKKCQNQLLQNSENDLWGEFIQEMVESQ